MNHISQGEKECRCILISKVKSDTPIKQDLNLKIDKNTNVDLTDKNNIEKKNNVETSQNIKRSKPKKSNSKQTLKTKLSSLKTDIEKTDDDDFDALLAEVVKADKTCSFDKCKKSVAVLSQVCQFCKGHFCFSHFIPEAHGCGYLAKQHARSQIRKEGKLYAGSGKPEKKVDQIKHSYLQKKLNEKINTLTNQRKPKPKE